MRLKKRVAIITGSARGMGKATALLFAQEGAKIVVNDCVNIREGKAVVEEINRLGGEAIFFQANISKPNHVKKLFQKAVKTYGTVDILVNNAGIKKDQKFLDIKPRDWDNIFSVNMKGTFLCSQEAAKIMLKKRRGKILNISSFRGLPHNGREGDMHYAASKAAVINFTKTLAKELAPRINVNCVAPGPTDTEMAKTWSPKVRKKVMESIYLKRLMQPKEIAQALLFLASDDANAITGEVLVVDGGSNLK